MKYLYWVIRYVPNVARGEFSNIGIVCGRDDGDWAVGFDARYVRNHGDLSSDLRELSSWTRWFRRTIDGHGGGDLEARSPKVRAGWIEHLRARQSNSVQFSEATPIEAESAREAVTLLFPHLVEREGARRRTSLNRRSMRAEVRDLLVHELDYSEGTDLFVQPKFSIGKQHGSFDIAAARETIRFTNVWAFNVAGLENLERDIQSWNFLVTRLRQDGAHLRISKGHQLDVPSQVPIQVVVDSPRPADEQWRADIFDAAREAWALNQVEIRDLGDYASALQEQSVYPRSGRY